MKTVRVVQPFNVCCTSTDQWGLAYKHPYEVVGYIGTLERDFWEKELKPFKNYKPSEASLKEQQEAKFSGKYSDKWVQENLPITYREIRTAMSRSSHLVWEINVQVGKDEYRRDIVIFSEPNAGLKELSILDYFRQVLITLKIKYLNLIGAWKEVDLPTHEELIQWKLNKKG